MKKKYIGCVILLSACLLTGCGSTIELTDEENNMVAEYMAGALLKYDYGYKEALIEVKKDSSKDEKPPKDENAVSDDVKVPEAADSNKSNEALNTDSKTEQTENKITESYSLGDLFEGKQYSLGYKNAVLCSSYPEKANDYFVVEAAPGKKLVVINLEVKNLSGKTNKVELAKEKIKYCLKISGKKYDKPLLTAIMNDVQYFSDTIKAGERKKAVLVFEVDKKVNLSDGTLSVSIDDKTADMKLK